MAHLTPGGRHHRAEGVASTKLSAIPPNIFNERAARDTCRRNLTLVTIDHANDRTLGSACQHAFTYAGPVTG